MPRISLGELVSLRATATFSWPGPALDAEPVVLVRMPARTFEVFAIEEDTDSGHLLYEEWAGEIARVRLVPFSDAGPSTVYVADLRWQKQAEVRAGFALTAGVLTGHDGVLAPDELRMIIAAGVDAQAWPADQRETFVRTRIEQVISWRDPQEAT